MKQKKILFLNNTLSLGGAERVLVDVLSLLDYERFSADLFVLSGQGELKSDLDSRVHILNSELKDYSCLTAEGFILFKKELMSRMLKKGVFIRDIPYVLSTGISAIKNKNFDMGKLSRRFLSDAAEVPGELTRTEYDMAVAFVEGGAPHYMKTRVRAKKTCAFIHVDYGKAGYDRNYDGGVYDDTDRIFCVSEEVKSSFIAIYPEYEKKTFVFENIIDAERVKRKAEGADAGVFNGEKRVKLLTVARLYPQKALSFSVNAAALLKQRGIDFIWCFLGDGIEMDFLKAQVKELGIEDNVRFMGLVSDPYGYLREADIYVHATAFEGKSIAVREAQILEKPMVLSRVSGNIDQGRDHETALFCELDEKDIADKTEELIRDKEMACDLGKAAGCIDQGKGNLRTLYELAET